MEDFAHATQLAGREEGGGRGEEGGGEESAIQGRHKVALGRQNTGKGGVRVLSHCSVYSCCVRCVL
jgi:hypothetical protein